MTVVHERGERPLVVVADEDEDEMTRLVVATACLGIDVDAVIASDCEAALALFRNFRPDAVLLDVMMGETSGFDPHPSDVGRRLRAHRCDGCPRRHGLHRPGVRLRGD